MEHNTAKKNQESESNETKFSVKKLAPFFIDEIVNISINPNGACRLQFATWQTGEDNKPLRVDSEIIMTKQTMNMLKEALPHAMSVAEAEMKKAANKKLDG